MSTWSIQECTAQKLTRRSFFVALATLVAPLIVGCKAPTQEPVYPAVDIIAHARVGATCMVTGALSPLGQETIKTPPINPVSSIDPMQDVQEKLIPFRPFRNPGTMTVWVSEFRDANGSTIDVLSREQLPAGEITICGRFLQEQRNAGASSFLVVHFFRPQGAADWIRSSGEVSVWRRPNRSR